MILYCHHLVGAFVCLSVCRVTAAMRLPACVSITGFGLPVRTSSPAQLLRSDIDLNGMARLCVLG